MERNFEYMKTTRRVHIILALTLSLALCLSGCNLFASDITQLKSATQGLDMIVSSYDQDGNKIDQIRGVSVDISPDSQFAITDSEGKTVEKSAVLNLTVGGHKMVHVGSTLLAYDSTLEDLIDVFAQTVDIENLDRSTPFINRLVHSLENLTTGKSMLILVRSQSGAPIATFAGNSVSYFSTGIDKSTSLLIDGKPLFIYRSDYTIYELALLRDE